MSLGLKANVDGSGAIQVGGTDAINLSTGLNATFVQNADLPNTFGFKNRIINGAMVIDQRNAGASVTPTDGQYLVDRFYVRVTQASKFTAQQNAGAVTPPVGFINYQGITSSSAYSVTSTDYFRLVQSIEGLNCTDLAWGTANAATITLSFWVRSSLTGTFGGALLNSAFNRSYPFSYTISSANTWTQISITIAGDTSGTWLTTNGVGIQVSFNLGTGTNRSGTANVWSSSEYYTPTGATSVVGTNGATFYITGVQLEKGSTATSFDYLDYGRSLAQCQRYYYKQQATSTISIFGSGFNNSTTLAVQNISFPVPLRTDPTALEQSGTAAHYQVYYAGGATACSAVPSFNSGNIWGGSILMTVASGLTTGQASLARSNNTAAYLAWSAEL